MSPALVAADSQFSCIWKLNVAKSKFTDGLAPKLHGKPSVGMGKLRSKTWKQGDPISWFVTGATVRESPRLPFPISG
jgi:hypothetical protein